MTRRVWGFEQSSHMYVVVRPMLPNAMAPVGSMAIRAFQSLGSYGIVGDRIRSPSSKNCQPR